MRWRRVFVGYMVTDETFNHMNECSKLPQKDNKTRHDWVGKAILW